MAAVKDQLQSYVSYVNELTDSSHAGKVGDAAKLLQVLKRHLNEREQIMLALSSQVDTLTTELQQVQQEREVFMSAQSLVDSNEGNEVESELQARLTELQQSLNAANNRCADLKEAYQQLAQSYQI